MIRMTLAIGSTLFTILFVEISPPLFEENIMSRPRLDAPVGIKLSRADRQRLEAMAERKQLTMCDIGRAALRQYLDRLEAEQNQSAA